MEMVSVIITTCKGSEKLARAIRSVLNQTYKHLEIIVVDDNGKGTEDQLYTESVIAPFLEKKQIKYIVHDVNKNGAVARNTGASAARGKYLAFLDDDDFFLPSRIKLLVQKAEESGVDLAYSNVVFLKGNQVIHGMQARTQGFTYKDLLEDQNLLGTGSNIFVSKETYNRIRGFDESFKRYQDIEFMIRALEVGRILGVDEYTVVKDISEVRFYPQYDKFLSIQEHFLNKFHDEINNLDSHERRHCLLFKRAELYYAACMSKKRNNKEDAMQRLQESIVDLKLHEKIKIKLRGIYMSSFYWISTHLRVLRETNRAKKTREGLPEQVQSEIEIIVLGKFVR